VVFLYYSLRFARLILNHGKEVNGMPIGKKRTSPKRPAGKRRPESKTATNSRRPKQRDAVDGEGVNRQPTLKRLIFGEEKPDLRELEAGSTTILDILSPTTINTKSRDYIVVDGVFHAYLYVTGYGYATTVGSCWLAPLVEAGEGVSISFSFERQSREKILSKISKATMMNRSRMRDVGDTRQDYEELDSAIASGLYLKEAMNRQGEDFYYMHTLVEVTANDPETLEQRVTAVEKLCVSVDMIARRCDYKQEQAFLSALPLLTLDEDIERKSRRNALTSGVAAAFPFASYELSDRNGIFLGLNMYNRSPAFLDPYNDYKYTNGSIWMGGSSGAGKTFTLCCLGGRLRQQGKRVIYIAPKKGHEFRPLCELMGGLYLRLSPSSKDCPNIMAIRRKSLDSYAGLKNLTARDDSVLAEKISHLIIWYSLQKRDLSDEDKNYLDSSLVECYRRYGITFDNASLVHEDGSFKEMPIIPDWYDVLAGDPETKHLSVVLARYVTGSAKAMGQRNDIDLNNKFIVLDTSGMPDDLQLPGIFWATDVANDLIVSSERELSALIADELWSLVGANSNPLAAGFVQEMVKTIRGLGGIAITSTQGMQDMFSLDGGKYGKSILDSSRIKLVMQMEEQEARLIQGVLNLSEDEVRQITRFRRGEGLLCIGYNHVPIAFHATHREYDAITTSSTDLRMNRNGGAT
jgi:DNA replication protein DnaC